MPSGLGSENITESKIIRLETLWNSVGNIVYLAAQWFLTYLVIRIMGYGNAGVFSVAMSVGTSLCSLAAYSMRNYQVSDLNSRFSNFQYICSRVITCTASLVACLIFLGFTDYTVKTSLCIFAYSIFKASEAFSDVYQAVFQRFRRMDYVGKAYLLKSVADVVIFGILLFSTNDLLVAIVGLAIVSWLEVFLYEGNHAKRLDTKDEEGRSYQASTNSMFFKGTWKLLLVCLPLAVCGFLSTTMGQVPRLFLEWRLGEEALGIYTTVAMPVMLLQVVANYIFTPLIVPFAKHYQDRNMKGFVGLFAKTLGIIGCISLVAFFGFWLLGDWIMSLFFGSSILPYLYLFYPLLISGILVAIFWFFSSLITIFRDLTALLVISICSFLVTVFSSVPLLDTFGLNGATYAYIAALFVFVFGECVVLLRNYLHSQNKENDSA